MGLGSSRWGLRQPPGHNSAVRAQLHRAFTRSSSRALPTGSSVPGQQTRGCILLPSSSRGICSQKGTTTTRQNLVVKHPLTRGAERVTKHPVRADEAPVLLTPQHRFSFLRQFSCTAGREAECDPVGMAWTTGGKQDRTTLAFTAGTWQNCRARQQREMHQRASSQSS